MDQVTVPVTPRVTRREIRNRSKLSTELHHGMPVILEIKVSLHSYELRCARASRGLCATFDAEDDSSCSLVLGSSSEVGGRSDSDRCVRRSYRSYLIQGIKIRMKDEMMSGLPSVASGTNICVPDTRDPEATASDLHRHRKHLHCNL